MKDTIDLPTALVLSRTLDLRPRRRAYVVPRETRVLDHRVSDWLLIAAIFPGSLGVFSGLVFVASRLGLGVFGQ